MKTIGIALAALLLVSSATLAQPASPPSSPSAAAAAVTAVGSRTIVLVRHGRYDEADDRDAKVGKALVPIGVAQARLAGARLHMRPDPFDDFSASPLTRARQTADVIAAELAVGAPRIDPDLEECTPPTRRADVMADEKPEDLAACATQLDRLAAKLFTPSASGDRHELIVAHGNVIRYLVTKALAVDSTAWLTFSVGHASVTELVVQSNGDVRIVAVGDVGHLPPGFQTGAVGDADRDLAPPAR